MDTVVGVTINGIVMLNGNSLEQMDPFYPKAWGTNTNAVAEAVDMCLGHPQAAGIYHYHIMPPCLFDTTIETTA